MFLHALLYLIAFIAVWFGSDLTVSSLSSLIKSYRLPPFTTSFFILGILTSLPEIVIGSLAVISSEPVIFVGNLLGGSLILFLLIIPLLGVVGKGVRLPKLLSQRDLLAILIVVIAPALCTVDRRLSLVEGVLLIGLYLALCVYLFRQHHLAEHFTLKHATQTKKPWRWQLLFLKIVCGVVLLSAASQQIISSTMYFSDLFKLSPFVVSLFIVSIGTNIPELSIIGTAIARKRKDIAFADYLGSATANTPLLGVLTILTGHQIPLPYKASLQSFCIGIGLILFFYFARSKNTLSRRESFVLLGCYVLLIVAEAVPSLMK